jgi:glycosyltransferase involved in cell wall biosynthesis
MSMTPGGVLLVTPSWGRDGGVAAHVKVAAAALAEQGIAVTVAAARVDNEGELPAGVTLRAAPALLDRDRAAEERLGGALSHRPEVIHLHQVDDDPELVSALRAVAPVVLTAHGYSACTSGVHYFRPGEECTRAHGPGCVPNLLLRGCAHTRHPKTLPLRYLGASRDRTALERADLVISGSRAIDRHLAANGASRRAIVPYFPTMAAKPGSGHAGRRRVLFAGRLVRPKGVGVLIRAARTVQAEFVLCGAGRELEAMRRLAERLGVGQRIRFEGWVEADRLAQEMADSSLVVIPSLWPEPFGLVGIEAFAAGRPVVASATGGIIDWLQDGVTGLSVPPGDVAALAGALEQLLADPERQHQMGQAGRAVVSERYTREHHVTGLLEAYRNAREHWQSTAPDAP